MDVRQSAFDLIHMRSRGRLGAVATIDSVQDTARAGENRASAAIARTTKIRAYLAICSLPTLKTKNRRIDNHSSVASLCDDHTIT